MVLRDGRKQRFLIIWTTYRMPFLIVLMRQLAYCLLLIPPLFLEYVIVLYSFIRCSAGGFRQQTSFQLHWPLHKGSSLRRQFAGKQVQITLCTFPSPFPHFHNLAILTVHSDSYPPSIHAHHAFVMGSSPAFLRLKSSAMKRLSEANGRDESRYRTPSWIFVFA